MTPVIELRQADVFYGGAQALHHLTLPIAPGEAIAIVGRNGAGKTTILRTMMGLLPCASGMRLIDGADATRQSPEWINRAGIAYVPEDRQVFSNLSVDENLDIATLVKARREGPRWSLEQIFELFPRLRERRNARAQMLSGGEQQMLAIGRALLCNPRLLLLDEPTEGLAPVVVDTLLQAMLRITRAGVAIALIEQNLRVPRKVALRFVVVDSGEIRWSGGRDELDAQMSRVEKLLSV